MANEDLSNNFYMAETFATIHPEIIAVLKGHPLYPALSKRVIVPETYLNQLWASLTFVPGTVTDNEFFYFKLINADTIRLRFDLDVFRFDLDLFRRAIGFPLPNAYPDKANYEPISSDTTILEGIHALGYEGDLPMISAFKRNSFAKRWCTLYMIINQCLTHSYSGMDALTKPVAQMLYAVAYHRHIDFAQIIWANLIKLVRKKEKYDNYIPYTRFLSIIIDHFLTTNPQIPTRTDEPQVALSPMRYTQDITGSNFAQPAQIPPTLLRLADRNDPSILRYRELVARTEPANPQAPAQQAHSTPGEGSSKKGSKRKSEGKRKEDDLGDETAKQLRQKCRHDRQLPSQTQQHKPESPLEPSVTPIAGQHTSSTLPTPTDTSIPEPTAQTSQSSSSGRRINITGKPKKKKLGKGPRTLETVVEEALEITELSPVVPVSAPDPASSSPQAQTNTGNEGADRPFNDDPFDIEQLDLELQGGTEGVVEKRLESERSRSVIGHKEKVSPPKTSERRVTTSATEKHVLRQGIEKDVSRPLVHVQSLPSHSVSQQREIVSRVHRDIPHNLPVSHLETKGIEQRDTQPQSRPSIHAQSSSSPRTQSIESVGLRGSAHLRDVAGTSVGSSVSADIRGSLGNPTSVIITPTLNVGHSTCISGALVVSTESLSGAGQSFSLDPAFESRLASMTRERVIHSRTTTTAPLYVSSTSSSTPSHPTSQTQPRPHSQPQSQPQSQSRSQTQTQSQTQQPFHTSTSLSSPLSQTPLTRLLTLENARNIFYAKLMNEPSLSPIDTAILSLLNTQMILNKQPQTDLTPILNRLDQMDRRLASLEARRRFPPPGRRQDDPDSQDPSEGENSGIGSSYVYQGESIGGQSY